jgi:hypothetical protein
MRRNLPYLVLKGPGRIHFAVGWGRIGVELEVVVYEAVTRRWWEPCGREAVVSRWLCVRDGDDGRLPSAELEQRKQTIMSCDY